jgi:hypothetical protein
MKEKSCVSVFEFLTGVRILEAHGKWNLVSFCDDVTVYIIS